MSVTKLDDTLSVTSQPLLDDFEDLADEGFKSVINNRPDGEKAGYPDAVVAQAEAEKHGLTYVHIPLVPNQLTPEIANAFVKAVADLPKPIVAHCATGLRSTLLWGIANVGELGVDGVMARASAAGYDLAKMRPVLEQAAAAA